MYDFRVPFDNNLEGANLGYANLEEADLGEAKYNDNTVWPEGFDPEEAGAKKVETEE